MNVLHAIHDFLPRHAAGSEIYAFELCRELSSRHHVAVLCAEYDPGRPHGHVTWRVQDTVPVIELVNNWACRSFEDTYRSPRMTEQLTHILRAVQPDVVHAHSLLNLSFDLPAAAHALGIPVVATVHDYTLVCPSGGQRLHRADQHVCHVIDPDRCARCFRESPFYPQMAVTRLAGVTGGPSLVHRAASALRARLPVLAGRIAGAVRHAAIVPISRHDIEARLAAARDVFDEVDLFVSPSHSLADELVRLGLSPSKMRVSDNGFVALRTPSGADAGSTRDDGRGSRPLRVGFVGTIAWHKGVHVLIDAMRRLPAGLAELKIFGSLDVFPDYVSELRAQAAEQPVRFMGGFDRDRTADVYAQIDVLVVPSLWLENSPLVIHEAFMAGVPVVGARMGGIPELVCDGDNGLLYDATSPGDLAAALHTLIEEPLRLERFRAKLPAVKSIAENAAEWEALYAGVIARRAAARAM